MSADGKMLGALRRVAAGDLLGFVSGERRIERRPSGIMLSQSAAQALLGEIAALREMPSTPGDGTS